jgi:polygalacturonase
MACFFLNNTINSSNLLAMGANENAFTLTACKNVVIKNNTFTTVWKPIITISNMAKQQIKTDVKDLYLKK